MKNLILSFLLLFFISCNTTQKTIKKSNLPEGAVKIANDELEYEIIIFDIGFETYLNSIARPISYYTESFLENRNRFYVATWNSRARNVINYNKNIYENVIDYDLNIHYGLEVNYKLYNYFKFVEYKYKEKF